MNALIEITVSDNCNKNCSYCFERRNSCQGEASACQNEKFNEWKPLILKACDDVAAGKLQGVDGITLTFWGGEPFIRYDRMLELIDLTSKYEFVSYYVYTNGTLSSETSLFVNDGRFKKVSGRFFVQMSYDGFPCNEKRRGYGFEDIRGQARAFIEARARVQFKATLCYDDVKLFPAAWDSYAGLAAEFPGVKYCPTLDSFGGNTPAPASWTDIVKELCRREYGFYRKNGYFLMSWFDDDRPRFCRLDHRVFLHTDGTQYVCHGCPYADDSRFKTGSAQDQSLQFIADKQVQAVDTCDDCNKCDATYCVYCNVAGMPAGDISKAWNSGRCNDKNKCQMYRIFGKYRRALTYALIKGK